MSCLETNIRQLDGLTPALTRSESLINSVSASSGLDTMLRRLEGLISAVMSGNGLTTVLNRPASLINSVSISYSLATVRVCSDRLATSLNGGKCMKTVLVCSGGLASKFARIHNSERLVPNYKLTCFATPFGDYLLVTPKDGVQWISDGMDLYYIVQSNVTWKVE